MKRAAVAVMVMLLGGCLGSRANNRTLAKVTAVTGGVSLGAAGYIGMVSLFPPADGCSYDDSCDPPPTGFAKTLAIGGVALVATTLVLVLVGDSTYEQEHPAWERDWARKQHAAQRAREDAWSITKVAAKAARDGDCSTVTSLGERIKALDEGVHASGFSRDVAVAWCLGPVGAPAPAPQPPRDRIKDRERAFAITKTASKAARDGNCADARAFGPQVRELDTNVHDAWFVRDVYIKACLQPAAPVPSP